jgi:hypothetical protein
VGGWDAISPLANMPVDRAVRLDNWVCRPGWIEIRKGFQPWCTGLGTGTVDPVETIMSYNSITGTRKLFGVAQGTIYDCSIKGTTTATSVTGLTNSRLQYVLFANPASSTYLVACNGVNGVYTFDGTTWVNQDNNIFIGNASGSITWNVNMVNSETITLNGTVVTFVTGSPSGNQVQIGVNLAATLTALVTFLNSSVDTNIFQCTYTQGLGTTLNIFYKTAGFAGNSFTIAASSAATSGSTLTGAGESYGITPSQFVAINNYMNRLWFVPINSTNVVFLQNVNAINGSASVFPLGSLMKKGGYIVAIGTWTVDTRQTVDEYIAFITSRGEVIVYQGTDPTTANTFGLVGIYQVGAPIGRRCFLRIAGDMQIITVDGVVGMSEMLSTDRAAANRVSLTSIIMNQINQLAQQYKNNFGWQLIEYPLGSLAILNIPQEENFQSIQFVMNTITGAWSRFIGLNPLGYQDQTYGMNANCWEIDSFDNIYFGDSSGNINQWYVGSGDNTKSIVSLVETAYNSFGNAAQVKRYTMLQSLLTTEGFPIPQIGINVDFNETNILSTDQPFPGAQGPLWDQVNWDQFNWSGGGTLAVTNTWNNVQGVGHYVSVVTRIISSPPPATDPTDYPIIQLNGWNILAESGAFV